ncbi:Protein rolling stone [Orchesella cincta]|uniref:Protein rolling stone n=1 Tax=Orchesella cincta TaxID=48709 RepID=A0A1D2MUC1_ORCCI|nr:Protein rolling stone [Orchesella cincta]
MAKNCLTKIKDDFNLNGITNVYFWKSEWESFHPYDKHTPVSPYFLAYRFIYFVYFFGSTIEIFTCDDGSNRFFFLFLTNQTFTIQLLYASAAFLYVLWVFLKQTWTRGCKGEDDMIPLTGFHLNDDDYQLPFACKALWISISVVQVVPYIVSGLYWVLLANDTTFTMPCDRIDNLLVHAFNSVMALLDSLVIAVPSRISHAVFPFAYGVFYALFTFLYEEWNGLYANDRGFIYPVLDWRANPTGALITSTGTIFGSVLLHLIMCWGVFRLRTAVKAKCEELYSMYFQE